MLWLAILFVAYICGVAFVMGAAWEARWGLAQSTIFALFWPLVLVGALLMWAGRR